MADEGGDHAREAASAVASTLVEAGFETYFAGGCVRDRLLGFDATDVDVATSATPREVANLFPRARGVGAHFGVMLVPVQRRLVEVATFRSDGVYHDGRHPESVTFGTAEADAERRDFTINGLFERPETGEVIDHVGGLGDLERRVIRAIGDPDARFEEDRLRVLRAVRFAARFEFEIAPETREAIAARVDRLGGVSPERVGHELRRMLDHDTWRLAIEWMERLGLDRAVLARGRDADPIGPLDPGARDAQWIDRLLAWEFDRGHVDPVDIDRRLAETLVLSNHERQSLADLVAIRGRIETAWASLGVAARKRLASHPLFGRASELLRPYAPELVASVVEDVASLRETGLAPTPWLSGADLLRLGFVPGPHLGRVLDRLYDLQLEGALASREDAIAAAQHLQARSD